MFGDDMEKKVCRECKQEKDISEFYGPYLYPSGVYWHENRCKECATTYRKKHQKDRGRRTRKKIVAVRNSLKQKPCADCGIQYPPHIMQFHHLVPSQKHKELSAIKSIKALMRESEKCIVLCANCHAIREFVK